MYYFDLLKALHDHQVDYLIVGGLAVNLHGAPRVTNDIDLIVSFKRKNLQRLLEALKLLQYRPRLPGVKGDDLLDESKRTEWVNTRNLKAFSFYNNNNSFEVVDVLLVHPLNFDNAFHNKVVKKIADFKINLVNIDDLITLKKFSGREQDSSDIKILELVKRLLDEEK